eukprot:scaffold1767_cov178-Ochromonas_danica.AAC.16
MRKPRSERRRTLHNLALLYQPAQSLVFWKYMIEMRSYWGREVWTTSGRRVRRRPNKPTLPPKVTEKNIMMKAQIVTTGTESSY